MRITVLVLVAFLACPLLTGCATTNDYVLVYLKTGPNAKDKTAAERESIQKAHLENIGRLGEEGKLVLAGPFGSVNHDPKTRGIFVFDVATIAEATALTNTDPAVQAGVLTLEPNTFTTSRDLCKARDADLASVEKAAREGRPLQMQERIRAYVLLRADDVNKAQPVVTLLLPAEQILLSGVVDGTRGFYILDATDVTSVRNALGPDAASIGDFTLDEWWGSKQLAATAK